MTTAEAAQQIGVTTTAVRAAIRAARLKATKRGREWWITPAALARYEASLTGVGRPRKNRYAHP